MAIKLEATMAKLKYYLSQPSTRVGIALLAGLFGVHMPAGVLDTVLNGIAGSIALYETFRDENKGA